MAGLRSAFVVSSTSDAPLNANAPAAGKVAEVSNFVTVQSLSSFAVAAAVLKTLWELLQSLVGADWPDSYWTPFILSLVYGAWQLGITLSGTSRVTGLMNIISAAVVAIVNSAILTASIIGITDAANVGTGG